ncbi:MAG: zf-HC2 domain-containing protein [Clostridiales bacterium]|jgi:predicted anti-sigma-YlaC factor YlaD|nr:zf-HC2 domain-containing protein [Clostridiales bacterium]
MNISCEVIKDLLPLYHDGVCSDESKSMVEEHLLGCDGCKIELQAIADTFSVDNAQRNLKDAEIVNKLSKRWRKGMTKSLLKGVLITVAVVAAVALVLFVFMDVRIV